MLPNNDSYPTAVNCCQLKKTDHLTQKQYEQIAALIFETDPYIYPAMFEGEIPAKEAAVKVLPEVILAGNDEMFRKENIFVCLAGEDIIGLILWYKGYMNWDVRAFLKTARQLGVNLSQDTVFAVGKEYVAEKYSETPLEGDVSIALINICVDEKMRGQGIGKKMMTDFIRKHSFVKMELCVLADNLSAVRLYQNMGFQIIRETQGFSLTEAKPSCYDMVRLPIIGG